jgi:hypothetical protein
LTKNSYFEIAVRTSVIPAILVIWPFNNFSKFIEKTKNLRISCFRAKPPLSSNPNFLELSRAHETSIKNISASLKFFKIGHEAPERIKNELKIGNRRYLWRFLWKTKFVWQLFEKRFLTKFWVWGSLKWSKLGRNTKFQLSCYLGQWNKISTKKTFKVLTKNATKRTTDSVGGKIKRNICVNRAKLLR